ncbi:MAG TPA: hypothetical protein VMG33_03945 [Steroidobacteraceae bacterium]|nr:hypothetical protein [Steroidobacteraceae bacterium]
MASRASDKARAAKKAASPFFRYERRSEPPLSRALFLRRLLRHVLLACALLAVSLAIGMLGYQHFEGLSWRDAFENSCMLLGGMGPVNNPSTDAGKVFAGWYALYAGIVFLVVATTILAPVLHRLLHLFHADEHDK